MPSRRAVVMGAFAASAGLPFAARGQTSPAGGPGENGTPPTTLRLQRRTIEVNGKAASVFGIRQPNGTFGITTAVASRSASAWKTPSTNRA